MLGRFPNSKTPYFFGRCIIVVKHTVFPISKAIYRESFCNGESIASRRRNDRILKRTSDRFLSHCFSTPFFFPSLRLLPLSTSVLPLLILFLFRFERKISNSECRISYKRNDKRGKVASFLQKGFVSAQSNNPVCLWLIQEEIFPLFFFFFFLLSFSVSFNGDGGRRRRPALSPSL